MADKPIKQTFWTFYYHDGPAPKFGKVEARDEAWALRVATRWCLQNGKRPPASVRPDILATEDILSAPMPVADESPLMLDPVGATTAVNG